MFPLRGAGLIGALLGVFAALNLLLPVVGEAGTSTAWALGAKGLVLGLFGAQLGLLAIWASLGPRNAWIQLLATMLLMLGLYGVLLLGFLMAEGWSQPVRDMGRSVLLLPLLFLAVQSPLWILRIVRGHRIAFRADGRQPSAVESRQFTLAHLLAATAVVAAALGLARIGMPEPSSSARGPDPALGLVAACIFCGLWSAFSILPCLWAAFAASNRGLSTAAIAVYVACMTLVVWAILNITASKGPPIEIVLFLFVLHGALVAVTLGTLHVVRSCGHVLVRAGRRGPSGPPAACSKDAAPSEPSPPATRQSS